ncbi:minor capsid protein [Listeria monocytogenes]|nr:minor capsid protein [Listeria monocytogenes]
MILKTTEKVKTTMTGSKTYWQQREHKHLKASVMDEKQATERINKIYSSAMEDVENDINRFYANYAGKEKISLTEAKKRASKLDVDAFANKAKKYVADRDFSPAANEELRLYNLTMKVNRLELLKADITLKLTGASDAVSKEVTKSLTKKAISEYTRQAGILGESIFHNAKTVDSLVNGSFLNATFSERIWSNQAELTNLLDTALRRAIMQGKHPRDTIKDIRSLVITDPKKPKETAQHIAERLLVTETARIQTEVQRDSFLQAGFGEYSFIAEPSACKRCSELDGKVFPVAEMMPGTNAAPMHAWCKCSCAASESRDSLEAGKIQNQEEQAKGSTGWKPPEELKNLKIYESDEAFERALGHKDWKESLSSEEHKAIEDYTFDEYYGLNRYLRNKNKMRAMGTFEPHHVKEKYEDLENKISSALQKSATPDNMIVYRAVKNMDFIRGLDTANGKTVFKDGGYMSTTPFMDSTFISGHVTKPAQKGQGASAYNLVEIALPKGTKGAYVKEFSMFDEEREFLLDKGTVFEYVGESTDPKTGIKTIKVQVVRQDGR